MPVWSLAENFRDSPVPRVAEVGEIWSDVGAAIATEIEIEVEA